MDRAAAIPATRDAAIRKALRALTTRSDRRGLLQLAGHLAVLAATGALVIWCRGGWAVVPAVAAHGIVLTFLFAPLHETIHRTAFRRRLLNDAVARAAGFLLVLPADYFRAFHFAHHRHTQDRRRDPELAAPPLAGGFGYLVHVSGLPYWRERIATTLRHALAGAAEPFLPDSQRPSIVREARLHVGGYLLVAAASLAAGSTLALWLWVIPALVGQPFLRLFLLAEHNGCPQVADMLANSRTTLTHPLLRALSWNMNLHTAHHAHPALPFHALPAADALLAPQIATRSRGYLSVQRDVWKRLAG